MNPSNFNAETILKNRLTLMDVELLLNPFRGSLYSEDDTAETQVVGTALANDALRKLLDVCAWLEELNEEAEKREGAQ